MIPPGQLVQLRLRDGRGIQAGTRRRGRLVPESVEHSHLRTWRHLVARQLELVAKPAALAGERERRSPRSPRALLARTTTNSGTAATASTSSATTSRPWPGSAARSPSSRPATAPSPAPALTSSPQPEPSRPSPARHQSRLRRRCRPPGWVPKFRHRGVRYGRQPCRLAASRVSRGKERSGRIDRQRAGRRAYHRVEWPWRAHRCGLIRLCRGISKECQDRRDAPVLGGFWA